MNETKIEQRFELSQLFDTLPLCSEVVQEMTLLEASRKTLRMDIAHFRPFVYISFPGVGGDLFRVQHISEQGAGIVAKDLTLVPQRLLLRDTHLFIGKNKIEIKTNLIYSNSGVGGIAFVEPLDRIKAVVANNFGFEILGASLEPKHLYSRIPGHPYRKLCYTDGLVTMAEFVFSGSGLHAFGLDLTHLNLKVRWTQGGTLQGAGNTPFQVNDPTLKLRVASFLQNLRGLNASTRQDVLETFQRSLGSVAA